MTPVRTAALVDCADVDVIELTPEEYETAKQEALDRLGVSYGELARQARARDFMSREARLLWVAIGD